MLKIKPVKQSKSYYCGPASLKMVLDYFSINKSQDSIAKLTNTSAKTGCSKEAIIVATKKLGLVVKSKDDATLKDLMSYIIKDVPVIVDWYSDKFEGHYSVVAGFEKLKMLYIDPYDGEQKKIYENEFLDRWFDFIGPPSKKGVSIKENDSY